MTKAAQESAVAIIRATGLKATKPRVAILSLLGTTLHPVSADDIFKKLKGVSDLVTVYRVLDAYTRLGIARRVDLHQGKHLYELKDEHDHHHLVCTSCGTTEDFTGCTIDTIAKSALKKSTRFAHITDHSLELFGRCKACAA